MVNSNAQTNNISGLYQSIVQHRIHQDQLLWSRVQLVHAIQVAVLAGGFALHFAWDHSWLGGGLLVGGGVLTFMLFCLVIGDYADMKVNEPIMDELAKRLLPSDIEGQVVWTDRTAPHRRLLSGLLSGHYMIYGSVIFLLIVDFSSGIILFWSA